MTRLRMFVALTIATALPLAGAAAQAPAKPSAQVPVQGWASSSGLIDLKPNARITGEQLADRAAITDTLNRWGIAYDEGDSDVIRSLFVPDGVLETYNADTGRRVGVNGIDKIIPYLTTSFKKQADQRRHLMGNVVVDLTSDRAATANAYALVSVAKTDLYLGAAAVYDAELEKGADQVWRFKRLTIGLDKYVSK